MKNYVNNMIPLGYASVPEDVSKCVSYLSSLDGDYMT
jgi:hypothetical protein